MRQGRAAMHADPGGVGVGLALPLSRPAEMRGRQAVPLQRGDYRQIGAHLRSGLRLCRRFENPEHPCYAPGRITLLA